MFWPKCRNASLATTGDKISQAEHWWVSVLVSRQSRQTSFSVVLVVPGSSHSQISPRLRDSKPVISVH